jgi:hypothetical protein
MRFSLIESIAPAQVQIGHGIEEEISEIIGS